MSNRRDAMALISKYLRTVKNPAAGFTLIEILVAIFIFSIAMLGLAIGSVSVIRANQTSYLRSAAINLAQARLEELRAMTATAFSGLACPTYATAGCSDTPTSAGKSFGRSWQITANSPVASVNRIDVKVDWTDYASQSLTVSSSVPQ